MKVNKKKLREEFIVNHLNANPCIDCGETNILILEFDHTRDKLYNISDMVWKNHSLDVLKNEINKCVVRCVRCHRIKTAKDQLFYNSITTSLSKAQKRRNIRLTLTQSYLNGKECEVCKESNILLLDFDHKDPKLKTGSIGHMIRNCSKEKIVEEMNKCRILCCACHRIKTAYESNFYKIQYVEIKKEQMLLYSFSGDDRNRTGVQDTR